MGMDNTVSLVDSMKAQLSCHNCLEIFKKPVNLTCGHSMCLHCYSQLFIEHSQNVICKICKKSSNIDPENLTPDYTLMGMLDVFYGFKPSDISTTSTTSELQLGSQDVCVILGCSAVGKCLGPSTELLLCEKHYDEDLNGLNDMVGDIKQNMDLHVGVEGSLSRAINLLECLIKVTTDLESEVGSIFRQLIKSATLKDEELRAGLRSKLHYLTSELAKLIKQRDYVFRKEKCLDIAMKDKDYRAALVTLRQMKALFQSSQNPEDYRAPKIRTTIESLSRRINHELDSCRLFSNGCSSLQEFCAALKQDQTPHAVSSFTLPFELVCIAVCSNCAGYFHNPDATNCTALGITGCVQNTENQNSVALPDVVLICYFTNLYPYFIVYSMGGKAVSLIDIRAIPNFNAASNCDFVCDSVSQSLFVNVIGRTSIVRTDLSGVVLLNITGFGNYALTLQFCVSPNFCDNDEHIGRLFLNMNNLNSLYKVSSNNNGQCFYLVYDICKSKFTLLGRINLPVNSVTDIATTYDQVFILLLQTKAIHVYSATSFAVLQTFQLTLDDALPMELAIDCRGILFIKDKKSKVFCYDSNTCELFGQLTFDLQDVPLKTSLNDFRRLCFLTCDDGYFLFSADNSAMILHILDIS